MACPRGAGDARRRAARALGDARAGARPGRAADDRLGDRVLHLEAGVHLQEEEALPLGVVEELDGAGTDVRDRLGGLARGARAARATTSAAMSGRGRLLDHLLVPALDASSRARRGRARRRAGRRPPGPRRAGRARGTARRRRCRRRTRTPPRPRPSRPRRASVVERRGRCACRARRRPPRPSPARGRSSSVTADGSQLGEHRHAGSRHQLLRLDLRAHRPRSTPGRDRPR